jgi:hypothetical protein
MDLLRITGAIRTCFALRRLVQLLLAGRVGSDIVA